MENILSRIERGQFWQFHGGIHPPGQKFLTTDKPIRPLTLPEQLVIPLQQHIGQAGELLVKTGDHVLKGQALTRSLHPMAVPIHAPTSGTVLAVQPATIAHPSNMQELCLFLQPDGEDTWRERHICPDFYQLSREQIVSKIANAGIAGMGGAGFPTSIKVNTKPAIDFLIINAAECEPYITADDLLMREHSATIVDGIKILDHLLLPEVILIGIEDNKPEAIKALQQATEHLDKVKVCVVPTIYPMGGEKQLIKALTGKEVPSGGLPSQLGVVMQNVATCFAIAEAVINDIPLLRRVVTVTGQALNKPQNLWALLGTPVAFLLAQCGYQATDKKHLIMGGPMMGFSLATDQVPIVKTTNCILAPSEKEIPADSKEVECIRCGQCAEVCPSQLLPQELQWSAKAKDYDQLKALNLFDCIDCGACAYVCPSQIPLVQYYRVAKAEIRQQQLQDIKAEKAKSRFEARKARLEREKKIREEKQRAAAEARRAKMNANTAEGANAKSAVAAALARVKAKKAQPQAEQNSSPEQQNSNVQASDQKSQVAAAIARAKAKKLAAQSSNTQPDNKQANDAEPAQATNTQTGVDKAADKKAQVAEAIARAKAKKLAAQEKQQHAQPAAAPSQTAKPTKTPASSSGEIQQQVKTDASQASDKKAKVAAAIAKAKAKAKKLEANTVQAPVQSDAGQKTPAITPTDANNDKKAKVAAAIAKAKAKKANARLAAEPEQAQKATVDDVESQSQISDATSAQTNSSPQQQPAIAPTDANNDKKAKVAAAIAKAKAKQAAKKNNSLEPNISPEQEKSSKPDAVESASSALKGDEGTTKDSTSVATDSTADDKKARIAAAVAKAKAKKLAANNGTAPTINTDISAADASDSVKQVAPTANTEPTGEIASADSATAGDDKKARIAAAIAKAKAKKQARAEQTAD